MQEMKCTVNSIDWKKGTKNVSVCAWYVDKHVETTTTCMLTPQTATLWQMF